MKKIQLIVRIIFGLMLIIFGLNIFLQFMPTPSMSSRAYEFMNVLVRSGYLMPFIAIIKITVGFLLLINKYQSLVLILIFPILLNAFLFHLFLAPMGIGGALIALVMNIFLFFVNKKSYKMLAKK